MAHFWISVIITASVANYAAASFQSDICSILRESHGFIPPPLPTNYEMRNERVDHLQNLTLYEEVYFDFSNSRVKYKTLAKGIEHHYILDYHTQQVIEYERLHPGSSFKEDPLSLICSAVNMEESSLMDLFGYQDIMKPRMYTSNQALRFGGQYLFAFNSSSRMSDRGLDVNTFAGCLYDKTGDFTIKGNYSFTAFKVAPSGGTTEEVVTGMEGNGLLSVPVKMDMMGVKGSVYEENPQYVNFDQTLGISWFQAEPEYRLETFQIPPWVYCENYRGRKDLPKFPNAFSTRLQITNFTLDSLGQMTVREKTSFEQLDYHNEKRLARRDYTPEDPTDSEIFSKFQSYAPVKTIYDYNEGIVYITHKPTGKCYIRPIIPGEFFDASKGSVFLKMASPEKVFQMETDEMEYKGTAFTRDIECDVWTGKYLNKDNNKTFVKETYISTYGWHEEADETIKYGVPVQHAIIDTSLDADLAENVSMYNFLKFKAKAPTLMYFDVSNCIETQDHQYLAIELKLSDEVRKLLFDYKLLFLETAQYYLTEISQVVTPLRIQRVQLRKLSNFNPKTFLVFALVGKTKLETLEIVTQAGASLEDAISNLRSFINRGGFAIQFVYPLPNPEEGKVTEMILITAEPSSLYNLTSTGDLQGPVRDPQENKMQIVELVQAPETIVLFDDEDVIEVTKEGMSPGALAALSIAMLFIGAGVGIACMYLYMRQFSPATLEDRIVMSNRPSQEGADAERHIEFVNPR